MKRIAKWMRRFKRTIRIRFKERDEIKEIAGTLDRLERIADKPTIVRNDRRILM